MFPSLKRLAEQLYFRGKQKIHNRLLHGYGVVSGLETDVAASTVTVSPGLALDPQGHEIALECPVELEIPRGARSVFLSLEYCEKETDPVPAGDGMQAARIEEGFRLTFEPAPAPGAIPVAKRINRSGRWRIDKRFRVPRAC